MKKYTEQMKCFLANQTVLYMKLHNLHWFIDGSGFFTLHAEFEKMYDATAEMIDEVAERLLMLGEVPVASLKDTLALATIEERESKSVGSEKSVKIVLADFKGMEASVKEIIVAAQEAGDDVTADMFTGYLADYQKTNWMLEAYLK